MNRKKKTMRLALMAMFISIELLLTFTPLGYIPLGFMNMTTLHIPVIIVGIVMGVKDGAILGLVFGLTSVFRATMMPIPTSFIFSPFITIGGVSGNFSSLLIAIVPRILIGVVAALIYQLLIKKHVKDVVAIILAAVAGTLTNTILVMSGIYFFFGEAYAAVTNIAYDLLIKSLMVVVTTNGIVEAFLGAFIVLGVVKAITPFIKTNMR
ncbi:MAG: ECF transporter S component [Erysipelotrichaceae bacterium]